MGTLNTLSTKAALFCFFTKMVDISIPFQVQGRKNI